MKRDRTRIAVFGLCLIAFAGAAAAQPDEEIGGREAGTAVRVLGTVKWIYANRGVEGQLAKGESIRYHWTLESGKSSGMMMSFKPRPGVLLMGAESELLVREDLECSSDCCVELECGSCRARLILGQWEDCKLHITTLAADIYAHGTDFALVSHPLYGTLLQVTEGSVRLELPHETLTLSAGGLILVRGGRTWLGLAAAEEAAPMRTFDVDPFPDPPALTLEQVFSRGPGIGIPR